MGTGAAAMSGGTRASDRRSRVTGVTSALWGAALRTTGPDLWYVLDGRRPGPLDEAAVRFLGVRHLTQGVLQAAMPGRFQRLYVAVDVTHAASMFWLAAVDERRRRPALVSGAVAMAAATVTLAAHRSRRRAVTVGEGRRAGAGSRPPRRVPAP
jgi:hypothetical protein